MSFRGLSGVSSMLNSSMLLLIRSFAFGCTNTPIVYAYRKFTCDEYYNSHPPYTGHGDRCSIHDIESSTAKSLSLSESPPPIPAL